MRQVITALLMSGILVLMAGYANADTEVLPSGDVDTDTARLISAFSSGGKVKLGAGIFKISGTGTEILKITKAGSYVGAGMSATKLQVQNGTSPITDIIRVAPESSISGLEISNFSIEPQSNVTPTGRHGINIDLSSAPSNTYLSMVHIHHLGGGNFQGNTLNGYTIFLAPHNLPNGFYTVKISESEITSGIQLNDAGDSIWIENNHFWGHNGGVDVVSSRYGANHITVQNNNAWVYDKPAVRINGNFALIKGNNFEVENVTDRTTNLAVVHLIGSEWDSARGSSSIVEGNTIIAKNYSGVQGLRIETCNLTTIRSNFISGDTYNSKEDIYIDENTTLSDISPNNYVNHSSV